MSTDCFILHDRSTVDTAASLMAYLERPNLTVAHGHSPTDCQVLIALISIPTQSLKRLLKAGTIIIPMYELIELDSLPSQWIETIHSRLACLHPPQFEAPLFRDDDELLDAAIATLGRVAEANEETDILTLLEALLQTTQELAESLLQTGQVQTAHALYIHANQILLTTIEDTEFDDYGTEVLASIGQIIRESSLEAIGSDEDFEEVVDKFTDCYNHLLLGLETSYGLQNIDALIDNIIVSGRPATASLIFDVITLSFTHGDDLLNRDAFQWALQIYLLAAQGIYRLIGDGGGLAEKTSDLAKDGLSFYAELEVDGPIANAEQLCGELRSALDGILQVAAAERSWEHDS
jgi:hypothetical protein